MSAAEDFAADVVTYLDGGADLATVRRLESRLRADPERRAEFVTLATMQGLLEDLRTGVDAPGIRLRPFAARGHPWRWYLAGAVAAVLAAGCAWWLLADPTIMRIDALTGGAVLVRSGQEQPLRQGQRLREGDTIRCAEHAAVGCLLADRSHLQFDLSALAVVHDRGDQPQVELEGGRLVAEVSPQNAGRHFQVRTARALITVIGTVFTITADASSSVLAVARGTVGVQALTALATPGPGAVLAVHAGQRASVDAAHGFVALLVTGEAPDAPPAPSQALLASTDRPFAEHSWWNRALPPAAASEPVASSTRIPWGDLEYAAQPRQLVLVGDDLPPHSVYLRGTSSVIAQAHYPSSVRLEPAVSQHGFLLLVDRTARVVYEGLHPEIRRDGNLAVASLNHYALDGDGLPQGLHGGLISGLPAAAGLIRADDLIHGIHHVLALTLPARCINPRAGADRAWVFPASAPDVAPSAWTGSGVVHLGSRLRLPAGTAASVPAGALRVLAEGLEDYGVCVVGISDRPSLCCDASAAATLARAQLTGALAQLALQLQAVLEPRP